VITDKKYDVTTLTASSYNRKISIELPLDANAYDLMEAFATLMKGLSFPDGVWEDMILMQAESIKELEQP
jgi:hypothetical protein